MSEQLKRCYYCGAVLDGGHTLFCPACWERYRPLDNLPRCRVCRRILIGFDDDICPPCAEAGKEAQCTACTASAETKSC